MSDLVALQSAIAPAKVTVTGLGTQVVTIQRTEACVHAQLKAWGASDEMANQFTPSLTTFPRTVSEVIVMEINAAAGKLKYYRVQAEEQPNNMVKLAAKMLEATAQLPSLQEPYTYHGTREM